MAVAHPELLWVLITSGITCAFLAISIGSNDVANAFSTSVGSGTLNLRGAIAIAFIFEIIGSISLGGRVSDAIRTRVLNFSAFSDSPYELALGMLCSSVGATCWLVFATYFGIPVSTTHSIIGALAGFGVASGRLSGVRWIQLLYIIISWFVVPVISIAVTGMFYLLIQELVLKRRNSFQIMWNFHWLFLGVFAIPLSVFIAFENSLLRAAQGSIPDAYRRWFEASNTNKFISVLVVLGILLAFSCLVTYTTCYFRMKFGWSNANLVNDIDPIFASLQRSKNSNESRQNGENQNTRARDSSEPNELLNAVAETENFNNTTARATSSQKGGDSELFTGDETSFAYVDGRNEATVTINPNGSMDINVGNDRVEVREVSKSNFPRSIINALLSSLGFPQSPRDSPPASEVSPTSRRNSQDVSFDSNVQHSGSRFNRMLFNIRKSYSRPSSSHKQSSMRSLSKSLSRSMRDSAGTERSESMRETQTMFSAMQIVGATIAVISHSANDTANAVSPFATVYFLYFDGLQQSTKNTPWYILLSGGFCMALGLALFGYKVIKTVGLKITRVTPSRGYIIDSTSGGIVLVLSHLGIPLSSTHVTVSSILGIGMIRHLPEDHSHARHHGSHADADASPPKEGLNATLDPESQAELPPEGEGAEHESRPPKSGILSRLTLQYVNLKLYRKIFFTWIITIFFSGIVTAILFLISKLIYNLNK